MFNFLKSKKDIVTTSIPAKIEESVGIPETFTDIRPQWKILASKKEVSSADMAALCIYRSFVKGEGKEGAISRLQKAFRPVTKPIKLANGAQPYGALKGALSSWRMNGSTFITWLTPEEKKLVLTMAQEIAKEWK